MKRAALALSALLFGCATQPAPAPVVTVAPVAAIAAAPKPSPGMQWLYGSGEGAATSLQTYRAFTAFALAAVKNRLRVGVVVADGDLRSARFEPCGDKPPAVILDSDETALQNLGYEYALAAGGKTSDSELLDHWQAVPQRTVAAMPGAIDALTKLRQAGVTVIFNSNRDKKDAEALSVTLTGIGLGPAVPGETLLTRGDIDGKGGKDRRRSFVADHYCVVAMAGDQLADFADGFNDRALSIAERRRLASSPPYAGLWGNGWFLLSNPVYGPGVRGGLGEVFAPNVRWNGEK